MKNLPGLRRLAGLVAATAVALPALAACSTGSADDDKAAPKATTSVDADAFPAKVTTSLGTAEIPEEPERVVTIDYVDADAVLSLGVVPIAAQKVTWGGTEDGSTVWFDEALAEIDGAEAPKRLDMTDGVPTDEIIALEPDLVVGTGGALTEQDYKKLTGAGIPVVGYPGAPWFTLWRDTVELAGQALGRTALAEEVIAETEKSIAEAREAHPQLEGASAAYAYLNPADTSTIGFYNAEENRPKLLAELGLTTPDVVKEVVPADVFYQTMSSERAADVDADVLLTDVESAEEVDVITADPLYSKIPAIASGNLYAEADHSIALPMSAPSPLSIPFAMENFVPKLAAAIDGSGS
ncbi:ABC transporter substrate-binding protein [Nocardioides sp. zg-ZUI104]|uniref:ABC transporter substrate-binding protein n=1 Tax=Nocardioides faecalis TaxID=2803858 RepID=UPI001BCEF871|nr:ABC transporter substrate-binding protein [Nocardioides faecalis]MBS4752913.1 ABC transporter substrate-binding protein [Nocardioides faecalis]